jgi:demethylspheroidene O-methyltransferase
MKAPAAPARPARRPLRDLRERWQDLRNTLLSSPRFQRWAAGFPATRPIARARARELFDIVAGFVYSQVLLACVRLKVLERLAEGPRTPEALGAEVDLAPERAERLLRAAAALRLAQPRGGGRYGLGDLGAALLGNPGIGAMIEHHVHLYGDLEDPVALLRGRRGDTRLARFWPYAVSGAPGGLEAGHVGGYSEVMAASQGFIADDVLAAWPLRRHEHLLDLAGGEGAFAAAAARRWPHLRITVFDLPAVAERAQARFREAGLEGRVAAAGGDLFTDPLPGGADVISLVRVLHDHDDDAVPAILAAARRALPGNGTLLVAEPMAGTPGAEPAGDAYFGLYLFAMGSGRPRTPAELRGMLHAAGFSRVRLVRTRRPLLTRLMVARP